MLFILDKYHITSKYKASKYSQKPPRVFDKLELKRNAQRVLTRPNQLIMYAKLK